MRPNMTEIVGNDALKTRLCRDIVNRTLPHALILEGPRGNGKHTIARMCAAAMACENQKHDAMPIPCLSCPSCRKIIEGKSPDLILVGTEGKTSIGVDAIRFLKEDVHIVPNDLEHKIYVIEDADRMTVQAQNALLLTLEEPPSFVHFFLLCEHAGLLLETIRSRAPVLRTEPLTAEQTDRYLCDHDARARQMKLASPKEYSELLKASGDGIGQALSLLDPKLFTPILEKRSLAVDFLTEAMTGHDMLPVLLRFSNKRDVVQEQLLCITEALRDLILLKKSETITLSFFVDFNLAIDLCDRVSLVFLYRLMESIQSAIDSCTRNANVRLALMRLVTDAGLM